jgi:hypothetical protein
MINSLVMIVCNWPPCLNRSLERLYTLTQATNLGGYSISIKTDSEREEVFALEEEHERKGQGEKSIKGTEMLTVFSSDWVTVRYRADNRSVVVFLSLQTEEPVDSLEDGLWRLSECSDDVNLRNKYQQLMRHSRKS